MRDGTTLKEICNKPPGSWGQPIDDVLHRAKLSDCLGVRLKRAEIDRVLDLLEHLETLDSARVTQLFELIA